MPRARAQLDVAVDLDRVLSLVVHRLVRPYGAALPRQISQGVVMKPGFMTTPMTQKARRDCFDG